MSQRSDKQFDKLLSNPIFEREELLLLAHVRALLGDEKNWVKGTTHRTAEDGHDQYCIQGAIQELMQSNGFTKVARKKAEELLTIVCEQTGRYQHFNDSHEHPVVMMMMLISKAIAIGLEAGKKGDTTAK